MGEYIKREDALKIIDNYSKAVTEEGKVVVDAIRDIIAVITPTADVVLKSEVERLQKENAELLLSETTELHLSMESLINVRVEHPIFKAIEGKVAGEIFDAFDKAIGSCEAWDHLPAVLLQLLAELKQKYLERSNDDNRTEHKETPKR